MLGLLNENDSTQSRSYNWPQLKRYAIYGCFIAGPLLHGWYQISLYFLARRFISFAYFYHLSLIICFYHKIVRHFMYICTYIYTHLYTRVIIFAINETRKLLIIKILSNDWISLDFIQIYFSLKSETNI